MIAEKCWRSERRMCGSLATIRKLVTNNLKMRLPGQYLAN